MKYKHYLEKITVCLTLLSSLILNKLSRIQYSLKKQKNKKKVYNFVFNNKFTVYKFKYKSIDKCDVLLLCVEYKKNNFFIFHLLLVNYCFICYRLTVDNKKMADKNQANQPQPIVKIGHYTLGQTLGVGTFGKVKSKTI